MQQHCMCVRQSLLVDFVPACRHYLPLLQTEEALWRGELPPLQRAGCRARLHWWALESPVNAFLLVGSKL